MGILEIFHAFSIPGNGFVLLRSLASFVGGLGFGFMWLTKTGNSQAVIKWMPWVITGAALAIGFWIIGFPEYLPVMVREGAFTPTAVAPKSFASMLFFAGSLRFFLDYRRSGSIGRYPVCLPGSHVWPRRTDVYVFRHLGQSMVVLAFPSIDGLFLSPWVCGARVFEYGLRITDIIDSDETC